MITLTVLPALLQVLLPCQIWYCLLLCMSQLRVTCHLMYYSNYSLYLNYLIIRLVTNWQHGEILNGTSRKYSLKIFYGTIYRVVIGISKMMHCGILFNALHVFQRCIGFCALGTGYIMSITNHIWNAALLITLNGLSMIGFLHNKFCWLL